MADRNLVSIAQSFTGLPMGDLIGGPLNAAAHANSAMAMTQTKFMLDTCFNRKEEEVSDPNDNTKKIKIFNYAPIMITMALKRTKFVEKADTTDPKKTTLVPEEYNTSFDLPLLTIIPLNSLGVDNVNIDFEMEVKSAFSEEDSEERASQFAGETSFEAKAGYGWFSASVKGNASYDSSEKTMSSTHYEKQNSAKYVVNVHAGQLPLPKGVTTIIDTFSKAIEPVEMKKKE